MRSDDRKQAPSGPAVAVGCVWLMVMALLVSPLLEGLVLARLWRWFVVAALHAPALSLGAAIGLRMTVGCLAPTPIPRPDPTIEHPVFTATLHVFLRPAVTLALGALCHALLGPR